MTQARRQGDAGVIPRSVGAIGPRRDGSTFARLVGAAGMITLTAVLFWLLTDDVFRVTEAGVRFRGLEHADEATVRAQLVDIDRAPNVFRVRAADLVREVSVLPEVDAAKATVTLPANVTVHLDEREPIFVWSNGSIAWLADVEGMLFGPGEPGQPGVSETGLPVVEDARLAEVPPTIGSHLPPADLDIMRRLLAITPETLGGRSASLWLRVDEFDGYVLHSDVGWQAVFGHYTPTVQPPDVIPLQVQCLRAALTAGEKRLNRIRLAVSDEACGTYTKFGGETAGGD